MVLLMICCFSRPLYAAFGDLDTTYGTGGIAVQNANDMQTMKDMALRNSRLYYMGTSDHDSEASTDNVMVLGGFGSLGNTLSSFADGTDPFTILDPSFTDSVAGVYMTTRPIAVDTSGRILAAYGSTLYRYNSDGSLDTTFATAGTYTATEGSIADVALDSAGNIVILLRNHESEYWRGFFLDACVVSGSYDADVCREFCYDSISSTRPANEEELLEAMNAVVPILAPGYLVRLDSAGSLDTTFTDSTDATDGIIDIAPLAFTYPQRLAITSSDAIVVVGFGNDDFFETDMDLIIAKYNQDGTVATGFGKNDGRSLSRLGYETLNIGATDGCNNVDRAADLAVDNSGRPVVAIKPYADNYCTATDISRDVTLARFASNGTLDRRNFGASGILAINGSSDDEYATALIATSTTYLGRVTINYFVTSYVETCGEFCSNLTIHKISQAGVSESSASIDHNEFDYAVGLVIDGRNRLWLGGYACLTSDADSCDILSARIDSGL